MKPLMEVLTLSAKFLDEHKILNSRRQAEELICSALNLSRMDLYTQHDRPLTEEELQHCRARIVRRSKHEPLAYILGSVPFHDCHFKVTPAVLIPRHETEYMVSEIIKELETQDLHGKILWDLCSGSGCIGISLKKRFPELEVVLSDISPEALEIASENARLNGVNVFLKKGDLFAPFEGLKADFITCNPPYIRVDEFVNLEPEVRDFEPYKALVSDETGLMFYQKFSDEWLKYINRPGKTWLEMGFAQANAVKNIFKQPDSINLSVHKDLSGHDRFFSLEIE
jgi:release factor glutamine methyltransferase